MRIIKLFLVISFVCFTINLHAQAKADPNFHVYLLLGQSNMAGRGVITDNYRSEEDPRVYMLNKAGDWVPAKHPLHFDKPQVAGVGPGLAFGEKMAEADPSVKIGLVPCAVGGTSIESWKPGGYDAATKTHPYDDALLRIRSAMQSGVVKGVLWHQGESDTKDPEHYLEKLVELIKRIRTEVNNSNLPFVAGELGRYRPAYSNISNEIDKLPAHLSHTAVVTTEGLVHKGDTTHFDSPSATMLGQRYAAQMLKLIHTNAGTSNRFIKYSFLHRRSYALNAFDVPGSRLMKGLPFSQAPFLLTIYKLPE